MACFVTTRHSVLGFTWVISPHSYNKLSFLMFLHHYYPQFKHEERENLWSSFKVTPSDKAELSFKLRPGW